MACSRGVLRGRIPGIRGAEHVTHNGGRRIQGRGRRLQDDVGTSEKLRTGKTVGNEIVQERMFQ